MLCNAGLRLVSGRPGVLSPCRDPALAEMDVLGRLSPRRNGMCTMVECNLQAIEVGTALWPVSRRSGICTMGECTCRLC